MRLSDWSSDVCSSDLIVIVPMLRDNEEDAAILDYCRDLEASLKALDAFREPVRVLLDISGAQAQTKRWGWEIGKASGRERVCQDVCISVRAVYLKKRIEK